jgi:hypothetical protein
MCVLRLSFTLFHYFIFHPSISQLPSLVLHAPQHVKEGAPLLLPRLTAGVGAKRTSAFVAPTFSRLTARQFSYHTSPPK